MFKSINLKPWVFDGCNSAILLTMSLGLFGPHEQNQNFDLAAGAWVLLAGFILGLTLSLIANRFHVITLGALLFARQSRLTAHAPLWRSVWGWQLLLTLLIAILMGARQTEFSFYELMDSDGFGSAQKLFFGLLQPDWTLLAVAVQKVIETIYIALIATLLAVPIAFVLAFFAAKNLMSHPAAFMLYGTLRTLFNIIRSVEPVIWAIIFAVWVGVGPFAGMLALMMQSIASLTKQYSELIESAQAGPIDSIAATGANKMQTIWYGVVPQVLLPYISFTIYRWDTNVRMATIIGFAGGGGIGTLLYQYSMRAQWPQVSCLIAVIAAVVWLLDISSAYLREALK
ncbi:MAG: phosphonate ABC transporter, permease protein PhnE [Bdellovibrionales bacterium]